MLTADITGTSAADGCVVGQRVPPSGSELVLKMSAAAEAVVALVVITEDVVAVAAVVAERRAVVAVK